MKKFIRTLFIFTGLLPISFGLAKNYDLTLELKQPKSASILNYDSSLGIFKDLTKEEVKSYYGALSSKTGLTGDEFLNELQNVIKNGHTQVSNSAAWDSNWTLFTLIDRDYLSDPLTEEEISTQTWKKDNVEVKPLYTDKTTFIKASKKVDREHIWPKSRGFKFATSTSEKGDEKPYAATDMHNLRMGESTNNQVGHNNYPFGTVKDKTASSTKAVSSSYTSTVTGYLGLNENNVTVYEPRDEDKGDIARSLFYMAARYHNYIDAETFQPALKLVDFSSSDNYNATIVAIDTKTSPATYGNLKDLLEWNILDPVDEYEIHRNNLVYNAIQHNRNPFIDYPLWANVAFGNKHLDLNQDNGLATGEPYIISHDSKREFELNDKIKTSDFHITYYDANGNPTELDTSSTLIKMYLVDKENNETLIKEGYVLDKVGSFKIKFTYFKDNIIYEAYCDISVKKLTTLEKLEKFYEQNQTIILVIVAIIVLAIVIALSLLKKKQQAKKTNTKNKNKTPRRKK